MITAVHRLGESACNRVAFYYDEVGAPVDRIEAERVELPNGDKPAPSTTMTCGSCGKEINPKECDFMPGKWEIT